MSLMDIQSRLNAMLVMAFLLAVAFGVLAQRSQFCTMGAISDLVITGDTRRVRQWAAALAVALVGVGGMTFLGWIDVANTIYNTSGLMWLAALVGGVCFGVGMVLASGCASKSLVRLAAGNLKSLVVLLCMGVTALATMRGVLALVRVQVLDVWQWDWQERAFAPQWLAGWLHLEPHAVSTWTSIVLGVGLWLWAWRKKEHFWREGVGPASLIGCVLVGMWWLTGDWAWVPEHPQTLEAVFLGTASGRMEALSFTAPVGAWLDAWLYWSDGSKRLTVGMTLIPGVLLGAWLSAYLGGGFRWEGFRQTSDLVRHVLGGCLMGFGGVTAMGCTIGQGLSGLSTLSVMSMLSLLAIVLGAVAAVQWEMRQ